MIDQERGPFCVVGVDIGGTNTKLIALTPTGTLVHQRTVPTQPQVNQSPYADEVLREVARLVADCEASGHTVRGIGVAVAGFVDAAHSCMVFNPNLTWLENYPLKRDLESHFGLPVVLEVDSNAAALAEATLGAGQASRRLLVLAIGTGVGGGMTIDGRLLRIAHECLGDIGHVIVEPGGLECAGGCRGCAEAMAAAPRLPGYALEVLAAGEPSSLRPLLARNGRLGPRDVIEAAKTGDPAAVAAIHKLGSYLGIALASMVPVLAPDMVVLAGGVSEAGEPLLDAVEKSFRSTCGPCYHEHVVIRTSTLGWKAVAVGAAAPLFAPQ